MNENKIYAMQLIMKMNKKKKKRTERMKESQNYLPSKDATQCSNGMKLSFITIMAKKDFH